MSMVLVRFHGYPGEPDVAGDGEPGVREMWLSRVPAIGETLLVDGKRLEVHHVEHDLTGVEVAGSGTTIGLNIDVHLGEPSARSWAAKRYAEPPALT